VDSNGKIASVGFEPLYKASLNGCRGNSEAAALSGKSLFAHGTRCEEVEPDLRVSDTVASPFRPAWCYAACK
jgi:hypothetical protein